MLIHWNSLEVFQDPEGWQIITQSYGLNEVLIRSIPLSRFTKAEKLIDSMEPPENRYDILCCYGFTTGYRSVVRSWFKVCLTTIFCFLPVFLTEISGHLICRMAENFYQTAGCQGSRVETIGKEATVCMRPAWDELVSKDVFNHQFSFFLL